MILIVDDDKEFCDELCRYVNSFEIDTKIVSTVQMMCEAVQNSAERFDAVLLDMMLPWSTDDIHGGLPPKKTIESLGGFQALAELRKIGFPLAKVVVLSAFPSVEAKTMLVKFGVPEEQCLLKPTKARMLLLQLRRAINVSNDA